MSRRTVPARLALVAAVLLMPPVARGAESLKWAPKPGETLRYTLSHALELKVKSQGQELSQKDEIEVDLTWKVASVFGPDGVGRARASQTLDRARIKHTAPGVALVYDTSDKKTADAAVNQPFVEAYRALLGKPYAIRLSPQGEVIDVKLPEGASARRWPARRSRRSPTRAASTRRRA